MLERLGVSISIYWRYKRNCPPVCHFSTHCANVYSVYSFEPSLGKHKNVILRERETIVFTNFWLRLFSKGFEASKYKKLEMFSAMSFGFQFERRKEAKMMKKNHVIIGLRGFFNPPCFASKNCMISSFSRFFFWPTRPRPNRCSLFSRRVSVRPSEKTKTITRYHGHHTWKQWPPIGWGLVGHS